MGNWPADTYVMSIVNKQECSRKETYHHVRPYVFPITCQHFTSSSYASLDLISNHQNVMFRTQVSDTFQIAIWWDYYLHV